MVTWLHHLHVSAHRLFAHANVNSWKHTHTYIRSSSSNFFYNPIWPLTVWTWFEYIYSISGTLTLIFKRVLNSLKALTSQNKAKASNFIYIIKPEIIQLNCPYAFSVNTKLILLISHCRNNHCSEQLLSYNWMPYVQYINKCIAMHIELVPSVCLLY